MSSSMTQPDRSSVIPMQVVEEIDPSRKISLKKVGMHAEFRDS